MAHPGNKENMMPKRSRIKYKPEQIEVLERSFEENHYPDTLQQERLAHELDITMDRISIWFQNRRSKFKRQRQADHMTWMRKQIFRSTDDENSGSLFGTPKLPALASACHVLSPLEARVSRDDNMADTLPGSSSPYMWTSVTPECTRPLPRNENYHPHQPTTAYQHNRNPSASSSYFSTPTRPAPDYTSTTTAMIQQAPLPLYDMFHIFSPAITSFYVPSMHTIAQSHVDRSRLDESEQRNYTVPSQHQPLNPKIDTNLKCENSSSYHSNVEQKSLTSSATTKQKFGWLDSDSDSSPTKDKTLECLAQWC